MKCTSTFLLLLTSVTLTHSICMDFSDPMDLSKLSIVDCTPKQNDNILNDNNFNNFQLNDNLIQVSFDCQVNDQKLCSQAKKAFNTAGEIVTYALSLNTPILINATFYDMLDNPAILGGATATRHILLLDQDDQVKRFYPQALVKQLQLPKKPAGYANSDITAEFNSLINWYLPDDEEPIRKDQYDLLNTVLHEIIHGLGFVSSWRNYLDAALGSPTEGLTPFIITNETDDPPDVPKDQFKFLGFYETIFDKFVMINDSSGKLSKLSTFANDLNQFAGSDQSFNRLSDFNTQLQNSPQYDAAKQVLSLSTIKNSLIFMPKGKTDIKKDGLVLETSIKPYVAGSSIAHVDFTTYNDGDSDFLMRYKSLVGETMNDLITKSGNRTGSAVGPKLLNVLSSIGYNLADNPIKNSASISIVMDFTFIILCIIFNLFLF